MKNIFVVLLLAGLMFACAEEFDLAEPLPTTIGAVMTTTRSIEISEYNTLPNPYSLEVMQFTIDSLSGGNAVDLEPTDLYVRFKPNSKAQLAVLRDTLGLELFDYPMDLVLEEDEEYIDPQISEGEIYWQYTTVSPDFVCPDSIVYEVIEECYIPDDSEEAVSRGEGDFGDLLEMAAMRHVGMEMEEDEDSLTRATWFSRERPDGYARVMDNSIGQYVPIKGVKIRCHNVVKWSTDYTDEKGYFRMDSRFRTHTIGNVTTRSTPMPEIRSSCRRNREIT